VADCGHSQFHPVATRACLLVALIVAGFAVLDAQRQSRDYVQWRGAQRDGSASAFVEPTVWPAELTRRWKIDVGEGYATPLIVGDVVYAFTRVDGEEGITALDAATGRQRWRTSYAAPYTPSKPAEKHGASPKATPLYYDGRLFTLGISGIVSAFDAKSGKQLWQTAAPKDAPFYGAAVSPIAFRDLVIVHPGDYGPLTAFDTRTGTVKWTAGSSGFFASPIVVTLDGRILWQFPFDAKGGATMPVVNNDTIIVNSPERVIAFRPRLRDGAWIVETMWETKDVSTYLSTPVVVDGVLYGLSTKQRGQFYAVDAKTGQVLWLGTPREADNTALVKAGQLLFLLNDDAELIVARSNRKAFAPIASYMVADSATWAQPAISGDRIFIKDVSTLALWTVR
jgi:hypothetical protein